jgi:hypothetical protein
VRARRFNPAKSGADCGVFSLPDSKGRGCVIVVVLALALAAGAVGVLSGVWRWRGAGRGITFCVPPSSLMCVMMQHSPHAHTHDARTRRAPRPPACNILLLIWWAGFDQQCICNSFPQRLPHAACPAVVRAICTSCSWVTAGVEAPPRTEQVARRHKQDARICKRLPLNGAAEPIRVALVSRARRCPPPERVVVPRPRPARRAPVIEMLAQVLCVRAIAIRAIRISENQPKTNTQQLQ